ncbi:MAG: complex I subunit 1/NuoH family protein, partial [Egibacteraceae bacterium]
PWGILQTMADGIKLFFKEDLLPEKADRRVFRLAPYLAAVPAFVTFAVVPVGGTISIGSHKTYLQLADPPIGILFLLAMSSVAVYGVMLAGWSSGSKYPLLGGVRSTAQLISYELAMSLAVAAVFVFTGSLRASDIVAAQSQQLFAPLPIPAWNVLPMLPAFVLFFIAAVAETQRPPFDLPEAEGELVAGFHTEYSGAKFAMFFLAEFMNVITMSAMVVTLFFGGPSGPVFGPPILRAILPVAYFVLKVFVFVFAFIWLRATLPRLRYDRLMDLGWRVMLPLGLVWVLATGFSVVIRQTTERATVLRYAAVGAVIAAVLYFVAPLFSHRPASPARERDAEQPKVRV